MVCGRRFDSSLPPFAEDVCGGCYAEEVYRASGTASLITDAARASERFGDDECERFTKERRT